MNEHHFSWSRVGPFAIVLAALLWSVDALMRQNLYSLPSIVIVFSEHALGVLITLPWLIQNRRKIMSLSNRTWVAIFWVALFGGIMGTLFYTKALSYIHYINFSVVVLLQKLQPIFAIFLAGFVLREKLRPRFLAWAVVALIGGFLVTFPSGRPTLIDGGKNVIAGLLAVGAAFAWGSSTVMGKYSLRNLDTRVVTPLRLGLTAAISGIYLLFNHDLLGVFPNITRTQWLFIIAIVFSSGTVALSIYYFGLKFVAASKSTILEMFWPLSAVTIDWVFFDHPLTVTQIMGAVLLLIAILQVTKRAAAIADENLT